MTTAMLEVHEEELGGEFEVTSEFIGKVGVFDTFLHEFPLSTPLPRMHR